MKSCKLFLSLLALTILSLSLTGCDKEKPCDIPDASVDLAPFIDMAKNAGCADITNELFLIDDQMVLWNRSGNCPDAGYSTTLFGNTIDERRCYLGDSIAGPRRGCDDDRYEEMFDTILENLDEPDLGLGDEHDVEKIPF